MAVSDGYTLRLITAPTVEPVSLSEAKQHLNVEHDDDDARISRMITAARRYVEAKTNSAIVRQKWRISVDVFSCELYLRKTPAQEIAAVQYIDTDGATQTASTALYELDRPAGILRLAYNQTWPNTQYQANAVWVDFWAGNYDPTASPVSIEADIPSDLQIAILMMVEHLYSNAGVKSEVELFSNPAFDMLCQPYWVPL